MLGSSRVGKYIILFLTSIVIIFSCRTSKEKIMQKNENHQILNGQVIKKEFINKAGKSLGYYEYYLRCSIQDYFIKFCESDVTKTEIDTLNLSEFDAVSVEAEIKDGNWDICPNDPQNIQSRIGRYVVIYKLYS